MHAPDWLTQRNGSLKQSPDRRSFYVMLNNTPAYRLTPTPADNRHACAIVFATNGRRLDHSATYSTGDEALRGGLEELRKHLGW